MDVKLPGRKQSKPGGSVTVVSVGRLQARALEAATGSDGLVVRKWGGVDVDEGSTTSSTGHRAARALSAAGISERRVLVCLPAQSVVVRRVTLPPAAAEQLPALVAYEAQRYLPIPLEQLATGFAVMGAKLRVSGAAPRTDVLLAVARRSELNDIAESFAAAGLAVTGFVVEALAAADATVSVLRNPDAGSLILTPTEEGWHAQILAGGRVLFQRFLSQRGDYQGDLQRSLAAYSVEASAMETGQAPIEEVLWHGEGDPDPVAHCLGLPVRRLEPAVSAAPTEFTLLLGAARQALGCGEFAVTLEPQARTARRPGPSRAGQAAIVAAAALLVGGLVFAQLDRQRVAGERVDRWDRLGREIEHDRKALATVTREHARVRAQCELLSGKLFSDGTTGASSGSPLEVLRKMAALAPRGVWLTEVTYARAQPLEVQGTARDGPQATAFLRALERSAGLGRVELSYLRSETEEGVPVTRFRMECGGPDVTAGEDGASTSASADAAPLPPAEPHGGPLSGPLGGVQDTL